MNRPPEPEFRFLFPDGNGRGPLSARPAAAAKLDTTVPLTRQADAGSSPDGACPGLRSGNPGSPNFPTYLDYFNAVRRGIERNMEKLARACSDAGGGAGPAIDKIDIISEKHGSDYHPARIKVQNGASSWSFVMNVAVAERGMGILPGEFQLLQRLNRDFRLKFLPRVYFAVEPSEVCAVGAWPMSMFLGEWFEDYHEFHLTHVAEGAGCQVVVWDNRGGHWKLSQHQRAELYRQTAFILSYYYDTRTFCEIYPWHHAAGDFVLRPVGDDLDVKLITARQYAPRVIFHAHAGQTSPPSTESRPPATCCESPNNGREQSHGRDVPEGCGGKGHSHEGDSPSWPACEHHPDNSIQALWLFLANLTLRNRLDRIDGVGEPAMADQGAVEPTLLGFAQALEVQVSEERLDPGLLRAFIEQAGAISPGELAGVFHDVVSSYPPEAPEIPLIEAHLVDHIFQVYRTLGQLQGSNANLAR